MIAKKYVVFLLVYCVVTVLAFLIAVFTIHGFPFFPQKIYSSTNETDKVQLEKGTYTVLYFIESQQELPVSRGGVGEIVITKVNPQGGDEPIKTVPSNYYFDDAPNRYGIRGHSVCSFSVQQNETVLIRTKLKNFGYSGFIIRTGFGRLVASVILYELFVLIISGGLTIGVLRKLNPKCVSPH